MTSGQSPPSARRANPMRACSARSASRHRSTARRVARTCSTQGGGRRLTRRRPTVAGREHQRAEAALGSLPQVVAGGVPRQRHDLVDGAAGGRLDVGLVEPGRHPDAEVVVARRRASPAWARTGSGASRSATTRNASPVSESPEGSDAAAPVRRRNRPSPRAWASRSG